MIVSRATFFKLHSWLGLITGAFLLVIAWTGSIAVFKDEIDWLLTPAARADASRPVRPLDEIVAAARARHPDRRIVLNMPYGPHWAYTAFAYGKGPTRFLYIDPAAAVVTQDDEMRGYAWNAGYFVRQLHVRMLMGLWGRVLVGLFGVALVLSVITSLWIYRDWFRSFVRVRRGAGRRIFHMDLHKAVGLWALAFNLMFGITGAVLGIENLYHQIYRERPAPGAAQASAPPPVAASALASAPASTPAPAPAAAVVDAAADPRPAGAAEGKAQVNAGATDVASAGRATALSHQPPPHDPLPLPLALDAPLTIGGAVAAIAAADRAFTPMVVEVVPAVAAGRGRVIVRGDHPGALIAKDASAYTIDLASGAVSGAIDARRAAWGDYLYNTLDPLHFGYFGDEAGAAVGYAVKVLWALAGLTPGVLSITGGYMWLLRRQRSRASAAARRAMDDARAGTPLSSPSVSSLPALDRAAPNRSVAARVQAVVLLACLVAGYWLQAAVWHRGWSFTELLWQHWIIKPLCLTIVCFPLTLAALWLGRSIVRAAGAGSGRPIATAVLFGLLAAAPVGLLYLAATSVLN